MAFGSLLTDVRAAPDDIEAAARTMARDVVKNSDRYDPLVVETAREVLLRPAGSIAEDHRKRVNAHYSRIQNALVDTFSIVDRVSKGFVDREEYAKILRALYDEGYILTKAY